MAQLPPHRPAYNEGNLASHHPVKARNNSRQWSPCCHQPCRTFGRCHGPPSSFTLRPRAAAPTRNRFVETEHTVFVAFTLHWEASRLSLIKYPNRFSVSTPSPPQSYPALETVHRSRSSWLPYRWSYLLRRARVCESKLSCRPLGRY